MLQNKKTPYNQPFMKKQFWLIPALVGLTLIVSGQTESHHHHDTHRNEIGIANAPVYFTREKTLAYEFHLHYIHRLPETKFGIGLGYERIFDKHRHQTIGLVGNFSPFDRLNLAIAPGVAFEKDGEKHFTTHLETSYDFDVHGFHLGPAFEIAIDREDIHLSLGLHVGIGW